MADKKITELTATTTLLDTDVFPVSVNVATTPETKKITRSDLYTALQISPQNYLINGGFDFAQRQAPGTDTTIATDKYGADRWRMSAENASIQYSRGSGDTNSLNAGQFNKITNQGKFMFYQIIEGVNSRSLLGKTVTFAISLYTPITDKIMRMGIIELNTSGTINTIPATFVTAWGANSTDPTLGTNLAYIGTPVSQNVVSGNFIQFSITVTLPSTSKNFIVAVWTDSQIAINGVIEATEAGLYIGSVAPEWNPRPIAEELVLCQRYYQKSYNIDTAPGAANNQTGLQIATVITPTANAGTYGTTRYATPLRNTATPILYSYAGTSGMVSVAAVDQAANSGVATFTSENSFTAYNNSGGNVVGSPIQWHFAVDAEL